MGNKPSISVADVYARLPQADGSALPRDERLPPQADGSALPKDERLPPQADGSALPRDVSTRAQTTNGSEFHGAADGLMIEVSIRNSKYRTRLISTPQWFSLGSCVVLRAADQNWVVFAQNALKTHINLNVVYLDMTDNEAGSTNADAICFLPSICEAFNAQLEALRERAQPLKLSPAKFDAIDLQIRDNVPFRAVTDGARVKIASMPTWLAEQEEVRFVANGKTWIFARLYGMKTNVDYPTFAWEQRNVPGPCRVKASELMLMCEGINEAIEKRLQSAPETIADANPDEPTDYNVDCVVCLDAIATRAFLPCGHKCVCGICSPRFNGSSCPICKTQIKRIVRIY